MLANNLMTHIPTWLMIWALSVEVPERPFPVGFTDLLGLLRANLPGMP